MIVPNLVDVPAVFSPALLSFRDPKMDISTKKSIFSVVSEILWTVNEWVLDRDKIGQSKSSTKLFLGVINELASKTYKSDSFPINKLLPGLPITPKLKKKQVANYFNQFFSAFGKNVSKAIVSNGKLMVNGAALGLNTIFSLHTVTLFDLSKQVVSLKGETSFWLICWSRILMSCNPFFHLVNSQRPVSFLSTKQ